MLALLLLAPIAVVLQPANSAQPLSAADVGLEAPSPDAAEPKLVRRGEPVAVVVRSGSLTISAPGRALADGRRGDLVRIVLLPSNRTSQGLVEATGTVRIASAN